jgi:hypothetical protein
MDIPASVVQSAVSMRLKRAAQSASAQTGDNLMAAQAEN